MEGRLVSITDGVITFQSPRFGEIRIGADKAIVKASPPPLVPTPSIPAPASPVADQPPSPPSPAVPDHPPSRWTRWWEPWSGRFFVSLEVTNNNNDEHNWLAEFRMQRRWTNDEVRLEPHYEFKTTKNDGANTDLLKVKGYWRHDLPHRWFTLYTPVFEQNREYKYQNIPLDYRMNRQSAGVGLRVIENKTNVLRVGVQENWIHVKLLPYPVQFEVWAESAFVEAELHFPHGWSLHETGQWLRYHGDRNPGWLNEIELNKALSDSLSLGLRHEYRKNSPEMGGDDYGKLRFLIGYDF